MRKLLLILTILGMFFLVTTQVLASPSSAGNPHKTPGTPPGPPVTPGLKKTKVPQIHGKPQHFRGLISAISETSLTLTLADGSSVTVALNADTRIHVPSARDGGVAALQVGMQVAALARSDESGNLVAQRVAVIPGKPSRTHWVGWVIDYQPGLSITIQTRDGNTYTFQFDPQVKILPAERAALLAPGAYVTIIAPRRPSQTSWTAVGIVVHPTTAAIPTVTATPTP
ncbi:MAG: DUF5666 domain-containing protein [Anaerolineales bacterium]